MTKQECMGRVVGLFSTIFMLSACGGGGGGDATTPAAPAPQPAVTAPAVAASAPADAAPAPATSAPAPAVPAPVPASGASASAPVPASLLQPSFYAVYNQQDGLVFTGAGAVSAKDSTGGTLSLGNKGETRLNVTASSPFTMTASGQDFRVFSRYEGSLLMLCSSSPTPGNTQAKFVAVATEGTAGSSVVVSLADSSEFRNRTFYLVSGCSYQSPLNTQGQDIAHDASTVSARVDSDGSFKNLSQEWAVYPAEQMKWMLRNTWYNSSKMAAYKINIGGSFKYFLIEMRAYDEPGFILGPVMLWLEE